MSGLGVGYASADITPGRDLDLGGYDERIAAGPSGNDGVRDRLRATAVMFDHGDVRLVLVGLDQLLLSVPGARRLRARVAAALALPVAQVRVACSHTHSGPWLEEPELQPLWRRIMPASVRPRAAAATAYHARLEAAIVAVASTAVRRLRPATLVAGDVAHHLGYCRRVPTGDGVAFCWNPALQNQLAPPPSADPMLGAIVARYRDGPGGVVIWSHGSHPVVLGKTSRVVSGDWPGAVDRALTAEGWDPLFVLGACGDIHPAEACQADTAAVDRVAAAALTGLRPLLAGLDARGSTALVARADTIAIHGTELDLAAWRLGPATLLTAPVECFAALVPPLRRAVAGPLLVATNCDGWTGYWGDREAWRRGGYEADIARACGRSPGDGEDLVAALAELQARLDAIEPR